MLPGGASIQSLDTAWRKWPWVKDTGFSNLVSVYSPVLGKLIEADQYVISQKKCPISVVRSGAFSAVDFHDNKKGQIVYWHALVNGAGSITYYIDRMPREFHGQPTMLVVTQSGWVVGTKGKPTVAAGQFVTSAIE